MLVRDVFDRDRDPWLRLWRGYNRYYEATVEPLVTDHTWRRILDPASPLLGRVAEREGSLVGMSVSVVHEGTWTIEPVLYLEDLFVDTKARGSGVGRALMEDVVAQAKARGCSRLYWHTWKDNETARRLYDSFLPADDFVRYRMILGGPAAPALTGPALEA